MLSIVDFWVDLKHNIIKLPRVFAVPPLESREFVQYYNPAAEEVLMKSMGPGQPIHQVEKDFEKIVLGVQNVKALGKSIMTQSAPLLL